MNKDETKNMQGAAILLMLFLHLFNNQARVENLCGSYLVLGDSPLVFILSRAANPVPFFLILSGYGLSCINQKGTLTPRSQLRRLARLYFFYALTLLVFVGIGSVISPHKYPSTPLEAALNLIGWSSSYNAETWFLFPYALISLSSRYLFILKRKFGTWPTLTCSFVLSISTSLLISRYGSAYLYTHQEAYLPILCLSFLFPFYIGAYFHELATRRGSLRFALPCRNITFPILLICLVALRCSTSHSFLNAVYAAGFILLFYNCPRHKCIDGFLKEMGKASMIMWFVHTYFCYYLFPKFIFAPRQPLAVFLLLLLCSYFTARLLTAIGAPVYNRLVGNKT